MPTYQLLDSTGKFIKEFVTPTVIPRGVHSMVELGGNNYLLRDAAASTVAQFISSTALTQGPVIIQPVS